MRSQIFCTPFSLIWLQLKVSYDALPAFSVLETSSNVGPVLGAVLSNKVFELNILIGTPLPLLGSFVLVPDKQKPPAPDGTAIASGHVLLADLRPSRSNFDHAIP